MSSGFDIAILGASGAVGRLMIELLEERDFPVNQLFLLTCEPAGEVSDTDDDDAHDDEVIRFKGKSIAVLDVADFDWSLAQLALFAVDAVTSARWAPLAADAGCVVIDNSAQFRYEADVPLVIPEVNPQQLADYRNGNIIASPSAVTTQLLLVLKPIHDAVGVSRVNVATYQSVSGSGKQGIDELAGQTAQLLNGRPADPKAYSKQIAFNVLPQIDAFLDNGYTREEMMMVWESQKILGDECVMVNPTAVRVPVFYGDAQAVHLETRAPIAAEEVRALLRHAPRVSLVEDEQDYPTPVTDATGCDVVMVARVREDISHPQGIALWIVADNTRTGMALNSIQIAERLVADYL